MLAGIFLVPLQRHLQGSEEGVGEEFDGLREHESNGGNVSDILDR
jgi:hypothetical protein